MKYIIVILFLGTGFAAQAQKLSKDEKKALKSEIKAMQKNPEKYKDFKEGIEDKRDQIKELDIQIQELEKSINQSESLINQKDKRIKELGDEIARLELENKERQNAISSQTDVSGRVYKVQIRVDESSLYKEIDPVTGEPRPIFVGDTDADGSKKYTLGYFRDQQEAETFKKYLQLLRVKDAIVVAYQDGQKIQ